MAAFRDKTRAEVLHDRMRLHFDYEHQSWIDVGVYLRCGHIIECVCYGASHEGEQHECKGHCN